MFRIAGLAVGTFLSAAAAAQTPVNPGGMPEGPQGRPIGMGEQDGPTDPASSQRLRMRADEEAAAQAGRDAKRRRGGSARPAKASEVTGGASVSDVAGEPLGTIEAVDADGAVVASPLGKVKVPVQAFGMGRKGLLVGITKAEFETLVRGAVAKAN